VGVWLALATGGVGALGIDLHWPRRVDSRMETGYPSQSLGIGDNLPGNLPQSESPCPRYAQIDKGFASCFAGCEGQLDHPRFARSSAFWAFPSAAWVRL